MVQPIYLKNGLGLLNLRTGETFCDISRDRNLNVKTARNGHRLVIDGSLHVYYQGDNTGYFKFCDLVETVNGILFKYGVEARQTEIKRLEFGFNIPTETPRDIIDAAILFDSATATKTYRTHEFYGKIWEFSEYHIKLYQKTSGSLRFEVKYLKSRRFHSFGIYALADIIDADCTTKLAHHVVNQIERFLFVPELSGQALPEILRGKWDKYRQDAFWIKLSKDRRYHHSTAVKNALRELGIKDYRTLLAERANTVLSIELGGDGDSYRATKSSLGLLGDLVAPNGGRDLTGNKTNSSAPREHYLPFITNIHPDGGIYIYTFHNNHILSDRHHLFESLYRHAGDYGCRVTGCHRARAPPAAVYKTNVL